MVYPMMLLFVGGGSMHVKADAVNSAVGRLGIGIGKETEKIQYLR